MKTYTACFRGKERGAIGSYSHFNVDIEADSVEKAAVKLYDTHDHIDSGILWLWSGKQTVSGHVPNAHARIKGNTHYVSTYNGYSWKQTDCKLHEVERIKAEHLADEAFMNRYMEVTA